LGEKWFGLLTAGKAVEFHGVAMNALCLVIPQNLLDLWLDLGNILLDDIPYDLQIDGVIAVNDSVLIQGRPHPECVCRYAFSNSS
jgi:hypothetical protein